MVTFGERLRIRRHWLLFRERNPAIYAPLTASVESLAASQPIPWEQFYAYGAGQDASDQ